MAEILPLEIPEETSDVAAFGFEPTQGGVCAAKGMRAYLEQMKNITILDRVVTIKSTVSEESLAQLEALADELSR